MDAEVPELRVLLRGANPPRLSLDVCSEGEAPGLERAPHCDVSNLITHSGVLRLRAKAVERAIAVKSEAVEWPFEIR